MFVLLDNIVVFLYWLVRQQIDDLRSSDWPIATATVLEAKSLRSMYPRTAARYGYTVDGKQYEGRYDKGFWASNSADRYAELLADIGQIWIRYNPAFPSRSLLRSTDPLSLPLNAHGSTF